MKELYTALIAAKKEFAQVNFDCVNPHFKSKYASLTEHINSISQALLKHGLTFYQKCDETDKGTILSTILIHESGQEKLLMEMPVLAIKRDAQGFGSALTYARRYSIAAAFGLAGEEDDDGNLAVASQNKQNQQNYGNKQNQQNHGNKQNQQNTQKKEDKLPLDKEWEIKKGKIEYLNHILKEMDLKNESEKLEKMNLMGIKVWGDLKTKSIEELDLITKKLKGE